MCLLKTERKNNKITIILIMIIMLIITMIINYVTVCFKSRA